MQKILDGLKARDEFPLYQFKARLQKGDDLLALLFGEGLDQSIQRRRFQEARYDGDLGGTKVGMVLFYTDLLAKLWALDYLHNAPGGKNAVEAPARAAALVGDPLGQLWTLPILAAAPARRIEDFVPLTDVRVSPIYKQEMKELTNTRLWFGPQNKGFQIGDGKKTLLFARNATRIFAKSRTEQSRLESQANAASEAFLGWWNDHYEEVARYEPEYQRLNAAMKWSLLCGWLTDAGQESRLDFLDSTRTPVDHNSWFPQWCRSQPGLRFHSWDSVAFLPEGYKGSKHEAMKIVYSDWYEEFGVESGLSGGVSLGDLELFKERPGLSALSRPTDALGLRGNLDLKALEAGGGRTLRTLDGLEFTFRDAGGKAAGEAEVLAKVPAPTKLRGRFEELANRSGGFGREGKGLNFERTLARDGDGLSVSTRTCAGKAAATRRWGRCTSGRRGTASPSNTPAVTLTWGIPSCGVWAAPKPPARCWPVIPTSRPLFGRRTAGSSSSAAANAGCGSSPKRRPAPRSQGAGRRARPTSRTAPSATTWRGCNPPTPPRNWAGRNISAWT